MPFDGGADGMGGDGRSDHDLGGSISGDFDTGDISSDPGASGSVSGDFGTGDIGMGGDDGWSGGRSWGGYGSKADLDRAMAAAQPMGTTATTDRHGNAHATDGRGNAWSYNTKTGQWDQTRKSTALGGSMLTTAGRNWAAEHNPSGRRDPYGRDWDQHFGDITREARFGGPMQAYEARGEFRQLQELAAKQGLDLKGYLDANPDMVNAAMQGIQRAQIAGQQPSLTDLQVAHLGGALTAEQGAMMANKQAAEARGTLGKMWDGITGTKREMSPQDFSNYSSKGALQDVTEGLSKGLAQMTDQGVLGPDRFGMTMEAFGDILGPFALAGAAGIGGPMIGGIGGLLTQKIGQAAGGAMLQPGIGIPGFGAIGRAKQAAELGDSRRAAEFAAEAFGGPIGGTLAGISAVDRMQKAMGIQPGYTETAQAERDKPQATRQEVARAKERAAQEAYTSALLRPELMPGLGMPAALPTTAAPTPSRRNFFVPMAGQGLGQYGRAFV